MTQKATTKDQRLALATVQGAYDTDDGGRQPHVRAQIREDWYGLARLAGMTEPEWRLLPLHDLVMIQRLSAVVVASAAEMTIVRIQQNQNETAFREVDL